ncbi:hypothetical protein BJ508DRAFT_368467 [Ascobolus immersus RN42]|uniref:Uncharacterized protein n=1 Tax=Ascobolus immersus RN42 TaxID=1160509 RepID=A0A3N4IQA8_ASCIM|nr:hypothetical protein BJ508DRAFT_368467 [Ascobolus immersus RN42]
MAPIALVEAKTPAVATQDEVLKKKDLGQIEVLDLPQLYTRPSYLTLTHLLHNLALPPPSWDAPANAPVADPKGLTKYLTTIISSPLKWLADDSEREQIWDLASARLSERCGRSARGDMSRTFRIPLGDGEETEVRIFEPSLTEDQLGLKTWGSAYSLCKRLPELYGEGKLVPRCEAGEKALELGSGTGLLGIGWAGVTGMGTVLTDLPEIEANLRRNVEDNRDDVAGVMEVGVLDWTRNGEATIGMGRYRVVLAADPIYSKEHPGWLVGVVVERLERREGARFVLEIPIREGYSWERDEVRRLLEEGGLEVVGEGRGVGRDDWGGGEVEGWWSVWTWKKECLE